MVLDPLQTATNTNILCCRHLNHLVWTVSEQSTLHEHHFPKIYVSSSRTCSTSSACMHSGRSCLLEIINQTTSYPSAQSNDPTCSDPSAANFLSSILASERRSRCVPSTINITAYRITQESKFMHHSLHSNVSRSFDSCCSHPHPTIAENFQTIPKYQRHTSCP